MFKTLDKYILRSLLSSIVVALLVLVSLDAFFGLLDELGDVGKRNYGYQQLMAYLFLTLPHRVYTFFPTGVLLGAVICLGGLASKSELIAIRSAGLSIWQIAGMVLKSGLILAFISLIVGEWLAPEMKNSAEQLKLQALTTQTVLKRENGLWLKVEQGILQAGIMIGDDEMGNVSLYEFDELKLKAVTTASKAKKSDNGWLLTDVNRIDFTQQKVLETQSDETLINFDLPDQLADVVANDPETLSLPSLNSAIRYSDENQLNSGSFKLEYWSRLAMPFIVFVMLLIALPFSFGSLRSGGLGQRLFIGVIVGVVFYLLDRMAGQIGVVYGVPAWISAFLPAVVFLLASFVLLKRSA